MRLVDLSHPIEHDMVTYPGLPAPAICDYWTFESTRGRYADGASFSIRRIDMLGNTGTYIDAPAHRYAGRTDVAGLALPTIADLDTVVVRALRADDDDPAVDADAFEGLELAGRAVLVHTSFDRHWRTERYGHDNPFLTEAAAQLLVDAGVRLVGIDSLNIDDARSMRRPVHTTLLGADVPIVEHLTNLGALPDGGARFSAVPAPVVGMGSFPVRAWARVG